ncbi:DUF6778 family protein [Primorskyibacter sp. S187A]|uniref:DUF6778 family protein n=1 Tax=Primorskyibacter sp. S187A TaxID=3415130 RepID=UPI003C7D5E83
MMMFTRFCALALVALGLSACAQPDTAMRNAAFEPPLSAPLTAPADRLGAFHIIATNVTVPRSLRVSEANRYYPSGDIVWREDPIGNRHDQVAQIFKQGVALGEPSVIGERPVVLNVQVTRFHAITEKARYTVGGVHDIDFIWWLSEPSTGGRLTEPKLVDANLDALGGRAAVAAENRGVTQKYRITHHLARVIVTELLTKDGWVTANYGFFDLVNEL